MMKYNQNEIVFFWLLLFRMVSNVFGTHNCVREKLQNAWSETVNDTYTVALNEKKKYQQQHFFSSVVLQEPHVYTRRRVSARRKKSSKA